MSEVQEKDSEDVIETGRNFHREGTMALVNICFI
jgi:hypothetical protein